MIKDSFSCGLLWHAASAQNVMLTRYNGSDHPHTNPIEGEEFAFSCHIHKATERYIEIGRKSEHFASETNRYQNVDDALKCLLQDCNISGMSADDDETQGNLFV